MAQPRSEAVEVGRGILTPHDHPHVVGVEVVAERVGAHFLSGEKVADQASALMQRGRVR
jgi:hypothetical protein